jgi:hypothetical protein
MAFRMRWPTLDGALTQRFGQNPHVYIKFGLPGHEGLDFRAPEGSGIYAVADGFVSDVRLDGFSDPMAKPYGNQVRVQHADGLESIYAHLSEAAVVRGQLVRAKQLIGLSGNTGHSSGAHLHLSLKHHGATARGETTFPHDLIDPEPYLVPFTAEERTGIDPPQPSMRVQVAPVEGGLLNVRALPSTGSAILQTVRQGAVFEALEHVEVVLNKVGVESQWLWVRSPDGQVGWVAAWYMRLEEGGPAGPAEELGGVCFVIVDSPGEHLRMRAGPGTEFEERARFPHGTQLKALEDARSVERKTGRQDEWLHVQAPSGLAGYCAAWHLKLKPFCDKPVIPTEPVAEPARWTIVESPGLGLRLRAGPGTSFKRVWTVPHKTVLESLEDPVVTGTKIGRQNAWLHVRTPALVEGHAAAWYMRRPKQEDERQPVSRSALRTGIAPHIYGIHAVSVADDPIWRDRIRGLYQGTSKKGWIFFTEACGRHADRIGASDEIRRRLWDWADQGYGVVIRLNHGYEPDGTLPESRYYADFAAAAAQWVAIYLRDKQRASSNFTWTLQIGNEQNNPREHPGGFERPVEHITAQLYAEAFNQAYAAIKAVLPNAIVCPGAIDPYNYMPMRALGDARWRPLDYFTSMLERIDALDGVILHAYTHGPDVNRVTHLKRFGDGTGPLWDHYYDFQTYRLFMERLPHKWRDLPAYITEINHIHRPAGEHDQGWSNKNIGWVRAIYAEINRWNQQPYAQQIHCGLLYRWTGDAWALEDKSEILADFRGALEGDYRWRSLPSSRGAFAFGVNGAVRSAIPEELEERFLMRPDDFTRLWGVGAKAEAALRAAGVLIFEQLAEFSSTELAKLVGETGLRARHLSSWPAQARMAAQGNWDGVNAIRHSLR